MLNRESIGRYGLDLVEHSHYHWLCGVWVGCLGIA